MDVAAMNIRIVILENAVITDEFGNHKNVWQEYFSCYATASGFSGEEKEEAGHTVVTEKQDFTVRFCRKMSAVIPEKFRVEFQGNLYNIKAVDPMGYKRKSLKLRCERVER